MAEVEAAERASALAEHISSAMRPLAAVLAIDTLWLIALIVATVVLRQRQPTKLPRAMIR